MCARVCVCVVMNVCNVVMWTGSSGLPDVI